MGWFSSNKSTGLPWKRLTSIEQLDEVLAQSSEKPILLFKHSTRCSISSMALSGFERSYDAPEEDMDIYYLDLIAHRDVSNAIAEKTGVVHQSPQVIVLKNNEITYTATHSGIDARAAIKSIRS